MGESRKGVADGDGFLIAGADGILLSYWWGTGGD